MRANPEGGIANCYATPKKAEASGEALQTIFDAEFRALSNGTKMKFLAPLEKFMEHEK